MAHPFPTYDAAMCAFERASEEERPAAARCVIDALASDIIGHLRTPEADDERPPAIGGEPGTFRAE